MTKKKTKNSKIYAQKAFLRLGGTPILDFCNTFICHGGRVEDRLPSLSDAQSFLTEFFQQPQKLNEDEFIEVIQFRAHLRSFFGSFLSGDRNTKEESAFKKWLSSHPLVPSLQSNEGEKGLTIKLEVLNKEDRHLENLILEFLSFSRKHLSNRLKKCGNPNCSHLFYDSSKANSRTWCSMKSCGNIMKARAFYDRQKIKN